MAKKEARLKVEDAIKDVLTGNVCEEALDFVVFLRENKLTTPWSATNLWKIRFKGKDIGFMSIYGTAAYRGLSENSWQICFTANEFATCDTVYGEQYMLSGSQKNIVWNTLNNCKNHPYQCNPG